jgi:hypothetical protein
MRPWIAASIGAAAAGCIALLAGRVHSVMPARGVPGVIASGAESQESVVTVVHKHVISVPETEATASTGAGYEAAPSPPAPTPTVMSTAAFAAAEEQRFQEARDDRTLAAKNSTIIRDLVSAALGSESRAMERVDCRGGECRAQFSFGKRENAVAGLRAIADSRVLVETRQGLSVFNGDEENPESASYLVYFHPPQEQLPAR